MPRFLKRDRLLTRKEFECVHKGGMRAGTEALFVSYTPQERARLGLVVACKVGNAAARNRIKRVIREHFRLNRQKYPAGDCVVVVKTPAASLPHKEIRTHLERVLNRLKAKADGCKKK